ncbi:MAG: hypothetical protein ACOX19_05700 [Fermentimonas sp.]|jgi:hypothetical protein
METKKTFKKSLKRGYILLRELAQIYNDEDIVLDNALTPEEIIKFEEIIKKMDEPNRQIFLTKENKRNMLKYLLDGELPPESDFNNKPNINCLTEEEQQFLIDMFIKIEET